MRKVTLLFLCMTMLTIAPLQAQQFLTPVSTITGDAVVETQDGRIIEGDIRTAMFGMKGLMSFRIKDAETGEVERFKAEDVKSVRIKMDGWGKLATLNQQTSNLSKMSSADFSEAADREYIYYDQVAWPGKKNKHMLVQLLNAGWADKIKVYDYPSKKTSTTSVGGIAVAGGDAKAYVVSYGGETMIVDKKKYQKTYFSQLFNDCEAFHEMEEKDTRFIHFASHVFLYETACE